MSLATLQKHYLRLIRLWPKDHLRGVLVQDALRKRLETRYLIPAAAPQKNVESNGALVMPAAKGEIDEKEEREQLNALYSLLENRYSKQYPVSDRLYRPTSDPEYYDKLTHEMELAPQRTWLQKKWLRLSQIVRFS